MKKSLRNILLIGMLIAVPMLSGLQAQPPTPPGTGNSGGTAMGGGAGNAPIEGGLAILMTLAISYGARKMQLKTKKEE